MITSFSPALPEMEKIPQDNGEMKGNSPIVYCLPLFMLTNVQCEERNIPLGKPSVSSGT